MLAYGSVPRSEREATLVKLLDDLVERLLAKVRDGKKVVFGLFEQLAVEDADPGAADNPVMSGGPVGTERGFVLHGKEHSFENTLTVSDEIQLTLSRDVIDAMATGEGPKKSLVAIGYAGWEPGQLEQEMLANSWLNVAATPELVFDTPFEDRWDSAARLLGVDIASISPDAGHA